MKACARKRAVLLFPLVLAVEFASGQNVSSARPPAIPTAAQRFKNIQVLKDMPADRLFPTMNFIAASLNVNCNFCHVDGPEFYKDDKKNKQTARDMMRMELAINQTNFKGETVVTCNTCHRGSPTPLGSPIFKLDEQTNLKPATSLPSASEIIQKYIQALGGARAIENIKSLIEKGSYSNSIFPGTFEFEAFSKPPSQRLEVIHYPEGDSLTAYSNKTGWTKSSSGSQPMSEAGANYFSYFAGMYPAINLEHMFTESKISPPEIIEGHETNVLIGLNHDQPSSTFYFDKQSGLLRRMLLYSKTPLGPNPVVVEYGDYREVAGTKLAFRRTFIQFGSQYTIQLREVQPNATIDDSRFSRPL